MRFRSRSNSEVARLASTSGHIILVGQEFVEVPQHMEAEAYANGCVSEELYNSIKADMAKGALAAGDGGGVQLPGGVTDGPGPEVIRQTTIRRSIRAMLDGKEEGAFTAAGLPNLKVLSGKCGFQVSKDEMEVAWGEISAAAAGE